MVLAARPVAVPCILDRLRTARRPRRGRPAAACGSCLPGHVQTDMAVALQGAGRGEAEDVVEAVRLAPVEHFRAGVVAVGADEDRDLRPVGPDRAHQAAEKSPDLSAVSPGAGAQERSDEATILVEDDDRL